MKPLIARRTCRDKLAVPRYQSRYENSHHGVLAHQDNALTSEGESDLVHLLGADIVDADDEDGPVLLEQAFEFVEIAGLVLGSAPHIFL